MKNSARTLLIVALIITATLALGAVQADRGEFGPTWGGGGPVATGCSGPFDQITIISGQQDGQLVLGSCLSARRAQHQLVRLVVGSKKMGWKRP